MKCPNCNHENFDGACFCTECGHTLSSVTICPNCGATDLTQNSRFCPHCGCSLSTESGMNRANVLPKETVIPPCPISSRVLEFKCTVVSLDGKRKGVLTVSPEKINFKTGGFIAFASGSVDFTMQIQNIVAIEDFYSEITIVNDDNQYVRIGSNGYFFGDDSVLKTICYVIELYRRLYWMYKACKYPNYPLLLKTGNSEAYDLNNISTDELINVYKNI